MRAAALQWALAAVLVAVDGVRGTRGDYGFSLPAAVLCAGLGLVVFAADRRPHGALFVVLLAALVLWLLAGLVVGERDAAFGINGPPAVVLTATMAITHMGALVATLLDG